MASDLRNIQQWRDKIEIVHDVYKIMNKLIETEQWDRLRTLYNGMYINTGKMVPTPFSDSTGVYDWLESNYELPPREELNQNAYLKLSKDFLGLRVGGKRSTRRHRSHRQKTRRHKK